MRIRKPSPDVLVAADTRAQSLVVGGLLAAAGGTAVSFATASGARHAWVGMLVGGLFALIGIAALRGIGTKTLTLDRTAGVARIRTRAALGTEAQTYRLADIADAVLEPQPMSDGRMMYRSAFVMRDGTHRAWEYCGLSGYPTEQVAVVKDVRTFLGTSSASSAPDGTPALPRPVPAAVAGVTLPTAGRRAAMAASTLAIALCMLFIAVGGRLLRTQHFELTAFLPVAARVQSTSVVTVQGTTGQVTQRPAVRYAYEVRGVSYSSDRVTPLSESGSGDWARTIVDRYHSGESVTAHYNPARPGDAYLEREESALPWAFVVFPLLMMGFWIALARSAVRAVPRGTFQPVVSSTGHQPRSTPTAPSA